MNAYYDAFTEVLRIQKLGGAEKPTAAMRRTTSGKYRHIMTGAIQPSRYQFKGQSRIDGYVNAQSATRIEIIEGENESGGITVIDTKSGEPLKSDTSPLRARKLLALKAKDGRWRTDRILSDEYFEPAEWADRPCMANTERPRS